MRHLSPGRVAFGRITRSTPAGPAGGTGADPALPPGRAPTAPGSSVAERDRADLDRGDGAVLGTGRRGADPLHDVAAGGDLAEGGVLAVQPRGRVGRDDE